MAIFNSYFDITRGYVHQKKRPKSLEISEKSWPQAVQPPFPQSSMVKSSAAASLLTPLRI
jgi:hypothetical protein